MNTITAIKTIKHWLRWNAGADIQQISPKRHKEAQIKICKEFQRLLERHIKLRAEADRLLHQRDGLLLALQKNEVKDD